MVSGVLWLLLFLLLALLVLVLAALVTPVKLGVSLRSAPRWRFRIALHLFGGLAPPIAILDSAHRKPKRRSAAKPKRPAEEKPVAAPRRMVARGSRVVAAAPRLVADLVRPIRLERLRIDADVGLADPADTGQLFGLLAALTHCLRPGLAVSVEVRPDFTGPRASGELEAVVGFVPAAFIPPGLRLAWRVFGPV